MSREIPLTRGKVAIVDDNDFDNLTQYKWMCSAYGYAVRFVGGRHNKKVVWMHRLILSDSCDIESQFVDHINGDKLDNRRTNLRKANKSQNSTNRPTQVNNTSGVTGVYWYKRGSAWEVRVSVDKVNKHIGYFTDLENAIKARKLAEDKYYGPYAYRPHERLESE